MVKDIFILYMYLIKTDTKFAVIYKENAIKNVRIQEELSDGQHDDNQHDDNFTKFVRQDNSHGRQ